MSLPIVNFNNFKNLVTTGVVIGNKCGDVLTQFYISIFHSLLYWDNDLKFEIFLMELKVRNVFIKE